MKEVLDLRAGRQKPVHVEQRELPIRHKKRHGALKILGVIVVSGVLATAGIKASDKLLAPKAEPGSSPCPEGMVFISSNQGGFCLDKYEVSAGNSCPNANPANQDETRKNLETSGCQPIARAGAVPWRNISQNQAAEACAKAGKRLPSSEEWLRAALATPDKESGWGSDDCQVSNNWKNQPGQAGSGKNCVSGNGVYDMIGNVWEWVDGTVTDGKFGDTALPSEGYVKGVDSNGLPTETNEELPDYNYYGDYLWIKKSGVRGIARGGYWGNGSEAGQYSAYVVTPPSFTGTGVGFRCAK